MERLSLQTSDGVTLEAELELPEVAIAVAVLAHPHPLYGGSMRGGVPDVLFDALPAAGIGALRFNFRGVEGSGGTHDHGNAERLDVLAALDAVPRKLPIVLCGYSFGGDVTLAVDDARVIAWCAVAPPLSIGQIVAGSDPRPKHLLVAEHDQYNPPERAREIVGRWANTTFEVVPMADHFLAGAMANVATSVTTFVRTLD